jgi:hypothetical protein
MDGSGSLFDEFASELRCRSIVLSYPTESFSGPLAIAPAANPPPQLKALGFESCLVAFALKPKTLCSVVPSKR